MTVCTITTITGT